MQEVEAPLERRVLIGCLETIASGRGIGMYEIFRQREKKKKNRGEITVTSQIVWGIALLNLTFTLPVASV